MDDNRYAAGCPGKWGVGSGEWGMGNGEWGLRYYFLFPTPHSPLPTSWITRVNVGDGVLGRADQVRVIRQCRVSQSLDRLRVLRSRYPAQRKRGFAPDLL